MCTRVFNNRSEHFLSTSRNMDWAETLPTSLYYFQSNLSREGLTESEFKAWNPDGTKYNPLTWTSEYASVVAMVGDDAAGWASSDGINSAGLVANVLYDTGFEPGFHANREQLSVLRWAQFILDNFSSALQVKEYFEDTPPQLVGTKVPSSEKAATLHLSVSDAQGESLIVEVQGGEYMFYYNHGYTIMTNEPSYKDQLILLNNLISRTKNDPDKTIAETIPGGPFSPERFERAAFYYHYLHTPETAHESLAQTKGVTASASVPVGFSLQGSGPNNASTLWTTVANQTEGQYQYYFNNSRVVNTVWFDMQTDLPNSPASSLGLVVWNNDDKRFENITYDGCINDKMRATSDPFKAS
ncbi:MAG: linear amide C-N hydrolase [bacterium]|nr:linear amide C-N hydrolase [bacterium]